MAACCHGCCHRLSFRFGKRWLYRLSTWILRFIVVLFVFVCLAGAVLYLRTIIRAKIKVHIGKHDAVYNGMSFEQSAHKRRSLYEVDRPKAETEGESFPRIIHQLWKTTAIPEQYQKAVAACKELNPSWQYRLWTDENIDRFVASEYPLFHDTFKSYKYPIQRVDVARYLILLHYGGVTIDIDLECRVPLDEILRNKASYDLVVPETDPAGVTVEFMAAKRRRHFLQHVVLDLNRAPPDYIFPYVTIIFSTGPMYLTNKLVDYPRYDEIYVIPRDTYRQQYFHNLHGGTWHRWDYILVRFLYNLISPVCLVLIFSALTCFLVYRRRQKQGKHALVVV